MHIHLSVVDGNCAISSHVRKAQMVSLAGTGMGEDTKSVCMGKMIIMLAGNEATISLSR